MICIKDLVKVYKNGVQALNGLSLNVESGEIFSLLGQNGAGKSTLINILTTFLRPTSGIVTMFGKDIYTQGSQIRPKISCVAQQTSIDTHLSLLENMIFQSKLYKIPKVEAKKRIETLVNCFDLNNYTKRPVLSYSGGIKRRLDIALNMMSKPNILFLDEPTVGMDIQSRIAMWEMVKKICSNFGTTIFLTTHYLEEADKLSDTICIIKDGKEVIQGTPNSLRSYLKQDILKISFDSQKTAQDYFEQIKDILNSNIVKLNSNKIIIHSNNSKNDLKFINYYLLERQIDFIGIEITQPTLEDIFIQLTGYSEKEEAYALA